MHRAVGDLIQFAIPDLECSTNVEVVGVVRRIYRGNALIEFQGRWYQESGQTITEVEPSVCDICDAFPCLCNQPSPNQPMNPTPFIELAALTAPKTPIACVEGTLTALYPPKEYASGVNAGKQFQNGEITSGGLKIKLKIDAPALVLDEKLYKGKIIRIESKSGAKGMSGLYHEIGEYPPGTEKRELRLTGTAIISFPGSSTNAPQSTGASNPVHTPDAGYDAAQRSSVQSRASSGDGSPMTTVAQRVVDILRISETVCAQAGRSYEEYLAGLTSEDIRTISTTVYLSYKDGYIHREPVFEGGMIAAAGTGNSVAGPTNSWQEASHPKSGVKIKDMDEAAFLKFARWAYAPNPAIPEGDVGREGRFFQANILAACEAKKMTPRTVFLAAFASTEGVGELFDDNDLEAVVGERFSKSSSNLTMAEWTECLRDFPKVIEDCKKEHEEGGFIPL